MNRMSPRTKCLTGADHLRCQWPLQGCSVCHMLSAQLFGGTVSESMNHIFHHRSVSLELVPCDVAGKAAVVCHLLSALVQLFGGTVSELMDHIFPQKKCLPGADHWRWIPFSEKNPQLTLFFSPDSRACVLSSEVFSKRSNFHGGGVKWSLSITAVFLHFFFL